MVVFVAIFWREDYRGGRNAVTHDCRSDTQRGIQHTLDYLCSGVKPNSMRGLKYPLPSDSKQVAVLLADLLSKVYGLDAEAGLAFAYHETAG